MYPHFIYNAGPYASNNGDFTWAEHIPAGWQNLFIELCNKIDNFMKEKGYTQPNIISISDVRVRFGGFNVYLNYNEVISKQDIEAIESMLVDYHEKSKKVCSVCGSPAKWATIGWVMPYCDSCAREEHPDINQRHKTEFSFDEIFSQIKEQS